MNLNFDKNTNHFSSKISKTVGLLNKLKYDLPTDVFYRLYISLVLPAIEVWGITYRCHLNKVIKAQNRQLKMFIICHLILTHPVYCSQMKSLKVSSLYDYGVSVMVYWAVNYNKNIHLLNDPFLMCILIIPGILLMSLLLFWKGLCLLLSWGSHLQVLNSGIWYHIQ